MNPSYHTTRLAERDLDEIWRYISRDNLQAADRVIDRITDKFAMLAGQPLIGEIRDDLQLPLRPFRSGST